MSMPLSSTLQSQIITDNHLLYHSKVNGELIRRYRRACLGTENIYLLPLVSGNNHNYDERNVTEIRKLDISKEYWPFNYMTEACRESNGITTIGRMLYRNLKITSTLDEVRDGICKKAHTATELAGGLRLNSFMKSPFDLVKDYTVHEVTLGLGCNISGYTGATIGCISTLSVLQAKGRANEQPRIDTYIDQIITVSGVAGSPEFALATLLNTNIELGNNSIIGIEAYPGTAEVHAKMGYKVIPDDEDAPLKHMTLQPSSLSELSELKNGEWDYIGK